MSRIKVGSDHTNDLYDPREREITITWDSYCYAHKNEGKSDEELKEGFIGVLARELSNKHKK